MNPFFDLIKVFIHFQYIQQHPFNFYSTKKLKIFHYYTIFHFFYFYSQFTPAYFISATTIIGYEKLLFCN